MSKKIFLLATVWLFSLSAYAEEGSTETTEATEGPSTQSSTLHKATAKKGTMETAHGPGRYGGEHEGGFYGITKYFVSTGDSYKHKGKTITGKTALGAGVDLGYHLGDHWATELHFVSGAGKFTEKVVSGGTSEESAPLIATYNNFGLSAVYGWTVSERFIILGKVGVVHESETLDTIGSSSATGLLYAVVGEFALNNNSELLFEIEDTTIPDPRAQTYFVGIKFGFDH